MKRLQAQGRSQFHRVSCVQMAVGLRPDTSLGKDTQGLTLDDHLVHAQAAAPDAAAGAKALLDHNHPPTGLCQLPGGHQTRGTGAGDDDVAAQRPGELGVVGRQNRLRHVCILKTVHALLPRCDPIWLNRVSPRRSTPPRPAGPRQRGRDAFRGSRSSCRRTPRPQCGTPRCLSPGRPCRLWS